MKHQRNLIRSAQVEVGQSLGRTAEVLWLSKGKVIVEQSFANLSAGGKYHHLLGNFDVRTLAEHGIEDVAQASDGIVYFATVGTFNQKDKEEGTLLVHKADIDTVEQSTWFVYDESYNLTDQQTDLLLELEPDAFDRCQCNDDTSSSPCCRSNSIYGHRRSARDPC